MSNKRILVVDILGTDIKKTATIQRLKREVGDLKGGGFILDFSGVKSMTKCCASAIVREYNTNVLDLTHASVNVKFAIKSASIG